MKRLYRLLFSRYTVSAVTILLEITLLLLLLLKATEVSYIVFIVATTINFVIVVAIVNSDTNPEYKISWVSVIVLLPFFGALLFLLFSKRRMTRREIRLGRAICEKIEGASDALDSFSALGEADSRAAGQALAIMKGDITSSVYTDTEATYFASGEGMFECMLEDMRTARRFILLEYFIVRDGVMWRSLCDVLMKKAEEGVEVRLLYDDIGCMGTIRLGDLRRFSDAGIKCAAFAKVNPSLSTVHNNRDHRKICAIDGLIAYTGGINIADEYINAEDRFGHWKDGGVRLFGDAAHGFVKLYLQNWSFNAGSCEDFSEYLLPRSHEVLSDGYFLPFGSGPAPIYPLPVGKTAFLNMINQAEHYLYITTPYLIIDFDLTEALRSAATRGVDVRIVTPAVADKKLVKIMTKSAYPYLVAAGVGIYEYTPGFIHEKLMVCDDLYTLIGSINLDYRSLAHHFECGVWMYSSKIAETARDEFMRTVSKSRKMDRESSKLTLFELLVKSIMRFLSPLL